MKILKAVVQPTLLYGCCSWAMTRSRERFLKTAQRKMLRSIIGTKRIPDETYVEWIIRATDVAEEARDHYNVPDWIEKVHRRMFNGPDTQHAGLTDDGQKKSYNGQWREKEAGPSSHKMVG